MNPKVQSLIVRAEAALRSQPPLGGSITVDFGDEIVFVGADKKIVPLSALPREPADCTITLSLDTLASLEGGDLFPLIDGEVRIDGNRDLAKKFAGIVRSAA